MQFELKTAVGSLLIPRQPMTIPSGSYGFFPFNLDCDGVTLEYATAQPLCRIATEKGAVYFFTALEGIRPELRLNPKAKQRIVGGGSVQWKPGTVPMTSVALPGGGTVSFVVLTPEQGKHFWHLPFAGRDRAILSPATVIADGTGLRLQADDVRDLSLLLFPAVTSAKVGTAKLAGSPDGIFTHFAAPATPRPAPIIISVSRQREAGPKATSLAGTNEGTWDDAAVYTLGIPPTVATRHVTLNINYIGDAARLYVGDKLLDDNFYNGDPFPLALWRIPSSEWASIQLKVLPYSDGLLGRLPDSAREKVNAAKAASALDKITVTPNEQHETDFASGK